MLNKCWNRLAVVLAVGSMLAVGLAGCNEAEVPEAEVIESEVVSETVSEEVSEEITSEAESESVEEETGGVETVQFSTLDELIEYTAERNQTAIVEFDFSIDGSTQSIIPNGAKYTMQKGERLRVIAIKEVKSIDANVDGLDIHAGTTQNVWIIGVLNSGTDMEVSFTVNYKDGTSEDFTIYVTKGGEESEDASQKEIEIVKFSNVEELIECAKERGETIITQFDFSIEGSTQVIIPNGAKYTMLMGERMRVIATKEVESIDANVDGLSVYKESVENVWVVGVLNSGTDMEVSFTVNYKDGTSEDFTIYVTKE